MPEPDGRRVDQPAPGNPDGDLIGGPVNAGQPLAATVSFDPDDPRVLQILSTEHWSLLTDRSLIYNEAFTRVGTFLTLVSMSLVALALLGQALEFDRGFLLVAAITLTFDLLVGLATIARVLGVVDQDLRAMHGMSRIRQGYLQVVPQVRPFFTSPVHDDLRSVMAGYGRAHTGITGFVYFLSTSLGLMILLVSVLAGIVAVVVVMAVGGAAAVAVACGILLIAISFVGLGLLSRRSILRGQAELESLFPSPADED